MPELTLSRARLALGLPPAEARRSSAEYLTHQAVADLFGDAAERPYLYRVERRWRGGAGLLILSTRPPLPLDQVDSPSHRRITAVESKPFAPTLRPGQPLDWELRLNATVAVLVKEGKSRRQDAWHAVWSADKETKETPESVYHTWLQPRLPGADITELHQVERQEVRARRHGSDDVPTYIAVDLLGALTVTDPDALLAAVATGLGRARAFGCGLLLLSRPGTVLTRGGDGL